MKRICVDMDEVLADTLAEHLARYNHEHGASIAKAELAGKWLYQVVAPDHVPRLEAYLRSDDFFTNLAVIPGSQRVMAALATRYEVFIATAAMEFPNSFGPKYHWLRRHFPFLDPHRFVFCGDKSILRADYLIDDQPLQVRRFTGQGVLFSAPHNLEVRGYRRADNWEQVEALFLRERAGAQKEGGP